MNIFLLILLFFAVNVNAQLLRQPITNFSPRDYGLSYSSYTYCIAEDKYGLIYIGSAEGILQYDGINWRPVFVKAGANVTAISVINDTVFVGTTNGDFGYLVPNEFGKYSYYSITSDYQDNLPAFSAIWKILQWDNKIVFHADESVFLFDGKSIEAIEPFTSYHMIYSINDELYARERFIGLQKFDGKAFVDVDNGELFAETRILSLLPHNNNSILVVTREDGLWLWENNAFSKIKLDKNIENLLTEAVIYGAIVLSDGNYAVFSLNNSIMVFNKSFELIKSYSVDSGLPTSEIIDLIQDSYGNLWAATLMGVNRIQYTSPFSIFNHTVGLYGSVQVVAAANDEILVGTSDNIYITEDSGIRLFRGVNRVNSSVWGIAEGPAGYFCAASNGIWLYDEKNFQRISSLGASSITYIKEKNWIATAGNRGVQLINAATGAIIKVIEDVRVEDAYGLAYTYDEMTSELEFWIGSRITGVWQLKISAGLNYSYSFYSGRKDGLDEGWICPYKVDNNVIFATNNGIFRFVSPDELKNAMQSSAEINSEIRGYFDINSFPKESGNRAITAFYYHDSISYAGLDYYVNSIYMNDSVADDYHFKTLQIGRINVINKHNNKLLVGGDNGLSIVDLNIIKERKYIPPVLTLRSISIGKDSVIWEGDIAPPDKTFVIPFNLNSVLIELSSTYYDNGFKARYSYKTLGRDSDYIRWSDQNVFPLNNLREGRYELVFAAKSVNDEIGNEIVLSFQILPPWYRSWWAYSSYFVILFLLVILTIHLNIRRLKAKTRKLERIVKERTKEIVEQKEYIEYQKNRIEDSIRYAQRIQNALLPTETCFEEFFEDYFILFKPKDVVSGDFYYATSLDDWVVVVAADCTGHGVPGAFMSMLGISFLNQITTRRNYVNAADILEKLRKAIIQSLKQSLDEDSQVDGMDLSLAIINKQTLKCHWAGAFNPLWIIRADVAGKTVHDPNEFVTEIKADKMPVAIFVRLNDFTNHEIQLNKGDRLYLFSDGYVDQFGGLQKKKLNKRGFKKMIAETSGMTMKEQGEFLEKTINDWINPKEGLMHDQIDDMIVLGLKI